MISATRVLTPIVAAAATALLLTAPAFSAEKAAPAAPAKAAPAAQPAPAAAPAEAAAPAAQEAPPAEAAAAPDAAAQPEAAAEPAAAEAQPAEAAPAAAEAAPAAEQPAAAEAPAAAPAKTAAAPAAPAAGAISSKDLVIGTPVMASDGVKIGEVNRVTSDASGAVSEIHVTAGGPAGLNAKVVSIPAKFITAVGKPVKVSISGADAKKLPLLEGSNG